MTTIYWAGGEDSDCFQVLGGSVTTTAGKFRSTYARCGLQNALAGTAYWQNQLPFSVSSFWFSAQHNFSGSGGITTTSGQNAISFVDASNITRLAIQGTGTNSTYKAVKINAAGTITQLGSNFSMPVGLSLDKIDVQIVDNASGTFNVYLNGNSVFTFSGDTTTDGISTIAYFRVGLCIATAQGASVWSEMIVADTDTRSFNLQTLAPVANGNTHNFDTGTPAAANINEITLNDATLDGSTTAGQIDQYTIPSIAAGTYTILAIGVSARLQKGASGPSKMDLGVRSGGSDFWSSDKTLTTAWSNYQNWWATDPNTSSTWAALPSNIGLKSVT